MNTIRLLIRERENIENSYLAYVSSNGELADFINHLDDLKYEIISINYTYHQLQKNLKKFYKKTELEIGGSNVK